ncbi:MAG: ribonuclease D [Thermodesulfobacteriota bacterium]
MTDAPLQDFLFVDTPAGLNTALRHLERVAAVAVDLEADSLYHFTEKVCLIQLAADDACFLVDPLALEDLSLLKPVFSNPAVTKVFHGADYDIRSLYRDFGIEVANLFDCEIASRFLGARATGLNDVVQERFGVALDKGCRKQDWSQRPLPEKMLTYAALDVRYLVALYQQLQRDLEQKGRAAWVAEECEILAGVRYTVLDEAPLFLKFKGAGRLGRRTLAVLEALLLARQEIAQTRDRPPFKVMGNDALLKVAQERPRTRKALEAMGVFSKKQMPMVADGVLNAVARAMALPEDELPVYPRTRQPAIPRGSARRIEALRKWRETAAARLDLDPGLVFPKSLVVAVAHKAPKTLKALGEIEGVRRWQVASLGEEILEVLGVAKPA